MTAIANPITVSVENEKFEIARPFSEFHQGTDREINRIIDALIEGEGTRMVIEAVGRSASVITVPLALLSEPSKVRELVITCLEGTDKGWGEHH